jgi:branched-chain amino acid transport system ATP-binding protein
MSPHEIARIGLRRTWQSVELFNDISISDNVLVALEDATFSSIIRDLIMPTKDKRKDRVDAALRAVGLDPGGNTDTSELSLGQQKLLGVARALVTQPKLLMLDEPAAGLSSAETQALGTRIVDIAHSGTAVLLVDHDMDLVLEICDRIFVLDFGRLIASGSPEQIQKDTAVIEAYLGATSEVES